MTVNRWYWITDITPSVPWPASNDHVNNSYSLTNLVYDGLDRLTNVSGNTGIGSSTMTYDALGNIKTYSSKGQNLTYTYNYTANTSQWGDNTTNRLRQVHDSEVQKDYLFFTYDDRGNITNTSFNNLTFNRANQLSAANGSNSYVYDGHGRRIKQTDSEGTSYSMYSLDGTLMYRENQYGDINYIYLGKKLIAKDGFIPENSGKQHYRPYGDSIEGATDDVGYTGHKFDKDLGLSYMQARYYDPVIGRFYSNDPVGSATHINSGNGMQGFNRYAYANNNPYKYVDPDGQAVLNINGNDMGTVNGNQLMQTINAQPNGSIKSMSLFNHGSPYSVSLNDGDLVIQDLTTSGVAVTTSDGKADLGGALSTKMADGSRVTLAACEAGKGANSLAASLSEALPNSTVTSYSGDARNYSKIGIDHNVGMGATFQNGEQVDSSVLFTEGDMDRIQSVPDKK